MHVFLISPVTIIIKEDDVSQDEMGSFHTKTTNAFEVVKLTMRTTCNGVNLCMMHHKYMMFFVMLSIFPDKFCMNKGRSFRH